MDQTGTIFVPKAIAPNRDYAEAHSNLGNILCDLDRHEEGIAAYRKAVPLKPDFAEAWMGFGNARQSLGDLDEAIECYRNTLAICPELTEAHRHIARLKKFTAYDHDIKSMEAAWDSPDFGENQRIDLAFGLGKAFEDLGRHEIAFQFFAAGNSLKRSAFEFSIESVEIQFNYLKDLFTKFLLAGCRKIFQQRRWIYQTDKRAVEQFKTYNKQDAA